MANWSDPEYRAFANWNYRWIGRNSKKERMECRSDSKFSGMVVYVYKNDKISKIGQSGKILATLEDLEEIIEVIKHGKELMKELGS